MTHRFKVLGIALAAVFALSVVASAAASAAEFHWDSGTVKLKASQQATQTFKTTSGNVTCQEVSGEATVSGTAATSVTGENIAYHNTGATTCSGPFGTSPTIEMNGCHYTFLNTGIVTLQGCNAVGHITVNAPGCTITVPQTQNFSSVTYTTNAGPPSTVTVTPNVTNIQYHHEGFLCGTGEATNGSYEGAVLIKGFNASNVQTNVSFK